MSDTIYNAFAGGMNTMATKLTAALCKDGITFILLKRGGNTSKYTAVETFTDGFIANWNEYRGQMQVQYASTTDKTNAFAQASHFAYGEPSVTGEVEVFAIEEPARDVIAPSDGFSPFWKVYGTKLPLERYQIETEEEEGE